MCSITWHKSINIQKKAQSPAQCMNYHVPINIIAYIIYATWVDIDRIWQKTQIQTNKFQHIEKCFHYLIGIWYNFNWIKSYTHWQTHLPHCSFSTSTLFLKIITYKHLSHNHKFGSSSSRHKQHFCKSSLLEGILSLFLPSFFVTKVCSSTQLPPSISVLLIL